MQRELLGERAAQVGVVVGDQDLADLRHQIGPGSSAAPCAQSMHCGDSGNAGFAPGQNRRPGPRRRGTPMLRPVVTRPFEAHGVGARVQSRLIQPCGSRRSAARHGRLQCRRGRRCRAPRSLRHHAPQARGRRRNAARDATDCSRLLIRADRPAAGDAPASPRDSAPTMGWCDDPEPGCVQPPGQVARSARPRASLAEDHVYDVIVVARPQPAPPRARARQRHLLPSGPARLRADRRLRRDPRHGHAAPAAAAGAAWRGSIVV